MLKKILLIIAMLLYAAASFAAVDVNQASAAELDAIKGIGPGLSGKIIEERKKGSFKDWSDLIHRVSGVGEKTAAKFSTQGLTVNGKKFAPAKPDAKDPKSSETQTPDKAPKKKDPAPAPAPKAAASASKK